MNKRPMTSEIIGKAHKLLEEMIRPGTWGQPKLDELMPGWSSEVRQAVKVYAGHAYELPPFPVDGFPTQKVPLPFAITLVELLLPMKRRVGQDDRDVTVFCLCRQLDHGAVDATFFTNHDSSVFGVMGGATIMNAGGAIAMPMSYVQGGPVDPAQATTLLAASQALYWALGAMSCSNVALVDHAPPDALNSKRSKAGKVPLFTYKTLHIVTDRDRTKRTARENDAEARQSPRLHLRRGHIRRLDEARMVWVQPAMVGDAERGKVVNAYAVTRKGGNGH